MFLKTSSAIGGFAWAAGAAERAFDWRAAGGADGVFARASSAACPWGKEIFCVGAEALLPLAANAAATSDTTAIPETPEIVL
jgi:hypothetical protein